MVRIKPLAAAAVEMQMPAVALTDINNAFGLIKFYKAANNAGVKPIVGADVSVPSEHPGLEPTPLAILACNEAGYLNLSELLSRAYLEGQKLGKVGIEQAWLAEQGEGLIALSGGRFGDIGQLLLAGKYELAKAAAQRWMAIYPDRFYLELQRTGRENEDAYIQEAVRLAIDLSCPVVATNDVRFLHQEEFDAHEVRVCIQDGRTIDDPRRERRYSEEQYLKSPEQMAELFADIPEALKNSVEIARRCSVDIVLGEYFLPEYPIPEGHTTESYFCEVSEQGLDERLTRILDPADPDYNEKRKAYDERLAFELGVINKMGFPGYFLIVMEFIQWAKENDIPVGPGRGSGAASLVAYVLNICDVDPIEYNLLFERFLNPERVSMPDFDIDFCMDGRDRVIQHVSELYGRNAVSQIITFGTMAAKAVVRDVARVQGKPYGLADKLSKLIPFDPGMTLTKALEEEPLLREFVNTNEDAGEIMEMAFKLEGLARNVGKHAGGVVIAPTKISDFSPVFCDEDGGSMMTQFDKDDVEEAGLVKFDFLGLRTLTIINNAVKSINVRKANLGEAPIDISAISLEDREIYEDFKEAKTTAVFQLESRGMKDLMKQVRPDRFGDIVALVALFRPGPLELAPDFIKRKRGDEEVDYLHPSLEPVLKDTYGVMLYQEQVMQISQILAGYSLADADLLRRAMGKKKPEEMAKQRHVFVAGAVKNNVDENQAGAIFDIMEKFAGYGFNKPHSVAYAWLAYQTAWLKHYYPADFMASVLSADMQTTDKVVINVEECREIGVPISPPDVNRGDFRFVANTKNSIIYGLGAIKGMGEGPVASIVEGRADGGPFTDLFDLCDRVDPRRVNKRAIEALIGSGALDRLAEFPGQTEAQKEIDFRRAMLMANQSDAVKLAEQRAHNQDGGIMDLFGEGLVAADSTDCRYNHFEGLRRITFKERLGREKETLGLFLTGHPIDLYKEELKFLSKSRIADLRVGKDDSTVVGLVVGIRTMKSKKGETIAFVTLDDRTGRIEVSVFADLYDRSYAKLQKDTVIVCKGATSIDDFSGGMRMRASEVFDIAQARERAIKRLKVRLVGADLGDNFTDELAQLLTPFKGRPGEGCPIAVAYVHEEAEAEITLGDAWRVMPDDDLIQNLRDRYGNERVLLDY
ncbi:MAG: DNA polymerase-3 subunit alpha [Candidatus Azotimanducaceae bacterium]|jgi:DNA polymerase-3 subunit alpha